MHEPTGPQAGQPRRHGPHFPRQYQGFEAPVLHDQDRTRTGGGVRLRRMGGVHGARLAQASRPPVHPPAHPPAGRDRLFRGGVRGARGRTPRRGGAPIHQGQRVGGR